MNKRQRINNWTHWNPNSMLHSLLKNYGKYFWFYSTQYKGNVWGRRPAQLKRLCYKILWKYMILKNIHFKLIMYTAVRVVDKMFTYKSTSQTVHRRTPAHIHAHNARLNVLLSYSDVHTEYIFLTELKGTN